MVSCTEFIWAYSELFKFIDERHGKDDVVALWQYLSDNFLGNLRDLVERRGAYGMAEYWGHTLPEEGADYTMTVREDFFQIVMHRCPSAELLRGSPAEGYRDYCEHCEWLYPPILREFGWETQVDYTDFRDGTCTFTMRRAGDGQ